MVDLRPAGRADPAIHLRPKSANFAPGCTKRSNRKDVDQAVKVMREVMSKGKDSNRLAAARLLLENAIGAPIEADILQRIETLEAAVNSRRL